MLFSEWTAFEFIALIAGYLTVEELAAAVILLNLLSLEEIVPIGIFDSTTSNVG